MGWFKKKPDPISSRVRTLNAEIAAIEARIKQLDSKLAEEKQEEKHEAGSGPRLRSTALPRGAAASSGAAQGAPTPAPPPPPKASEPIFEDVDQHRLKDRGEAPTTPEHYNDLGVRKYDLAALFRRIKSQFSGPSTANPKLVSYLAAGSIQGLRPMRFEKRVARNRLLAVCILFFLVLAGIIAMVARRH